MKGESSASIDFLFIAQCQRDLHHATFSNLNWDELSAPQSYKYNLAS